MPGKVRTVRTPPAALVQTGEANKGYRFLSGSMGAAAPAPPAETAFEASEDFSAREVAAREAALGIEPESVPAAGYAPFQPPAYYVPSTDLGPSRSRSDADLSCLPDRFTLEIERKGATWVIRAPGVHQALFVADGDLVEALAAAPERLAEIVTVDGIVPVRKKRK